MLDSYSFDVDEKSAIDSYINHYNAFLRIYFRLGLKVIPNSAATGEIGGDLSHEFNIVAPSGESSVFVEDGYIEAVENFQKQIDPYNPQDYYNPLSNFYAKTDEKIIDEYSKNHTNLSGYQKLLIEGKEKLKDEEISKISGKKVKEYKTIELGHTFYFADKYSKPMNMLISDKNGSQINPQMGSYGIGPARVMAAFIELNHDENGIKFNSALSPFDVIIINLINTDHSRAKKIYEILSKSGLDCLLDETSDSAGQKFAKADLIGISVQVIVSQKLADDEAELVFRFLKPSKQQKDRQSGVFQNSQKFENFDKSYSDHLALLGLQASQIVKINTLCELIKKSIR